MNVKNKRGDVAVTILVIGVFLVCSFALLTFFIADFKFSNSFVGVELMEKVNVQIDEYLFYKNQGVEFENIVKNLGATKNSQSRYVLYFEQKSPDSFLFKEKLLFSVEYPIQ
jgi:hypothetical protein